MTASKQSFTSGGAEGASYFDSATRLTQPGFEVEELDPTGGTGFGATFVSCWLRNMPPARCLAYAAASGSLAVTRQGPMEGCSAKPISMLSSWVISESPCHGLAPPFARERTAD